MKNIASMLTVVVSEKIQWMRMQDIPARIDVSGIAVVMSSLGMIYTYDLDDPARRRLFLGLRDCVPQMMCTIIEKPKKEV